MMPLAAIDLPTFAGLCSAVLAGFTLALSLIGPWLQRHYPHTPIEFAWLHQLGWLLVTTAVWSGGTGVLLALNGEREPAVALAVVGAALVFLRTHLLRALVRAASDARRAANDDGIESGSAGAGRSPTQIHRILALAMALSLVIAAVSLALIALNLVAG